MKSIMKKLGLGIKVEWHKYRWPYLEVGVPVHGQQGVGEASRESQTIAGHHSGCRQRAVRQMLVAFLSDFQSFSNKTSLLEMTTGTLHDGG